MDDHPNDFYHIVLTNFNCGLYSTKGRTRRRLAASRDPNSWFEHRCSLFERFTLPSMANQSSQDFEWRILVDIETPDNHRKKLESYKYSNIKLVENAKIFPEDVGDKDWLITTRIDNDDAFHKDALKTVQEKIARTDETAFYFGLGYSLWKRNLALWGYNQNMFPSFIAKVPESGEIKTVYCATHRKLYKVAKNYQLLKGSPMWLMVVHERNISNKHRGRPMDRVPERLSDFSVLLPED